MVGDDAWVAIEPHYPKNEPGARRIANFLDFTVDHNPYKHGRNTPGIHIPIYPVEAIDDAKPDYILILP